MFFMTKKKLILLENYMYIINRTGIVNRTDSIANRILVWIYSSSIEDKIPKTPNILHLINFCI